MRTNQEIRNDARVMLSGKWGNAVGVTLVALLLNGVVGSLSPVEPTNILYTVAYIFVGIPLNFGVIVAFLRFVRGNELTVESIFGAFNSTYYIKSIACCLLMAIYTALWSLLFIVPGIIKALSYFLAPYILADNPQLSSEQAICQSMKMMEGHKMDLFLMTLGYVGLALLSVPLLCIPMLWIMPYYFASYAKFYEEVKAEYRPIL